jgi:hypothetical protein
MAPRGPLIEDTNHLRRRLRLNHLLPYQRRSPCATSGSTEAAPGRRYIPLMKSRRRIAFPKDMDTRLQ